MHIDKSIVESPDAYPVTLKLRHLTDDEATPEQQLGAGNTERSENKPQDGLFRSNLAPDDAQDLLKKSSGKQGTAETIHAKYVIGCDGAHSWTRQQLGFEMEGEATDFIWGVLGMITIDFGALRN